jgi:tetratricopeptide (TPR) repeat protein
LCAFEETEQRLGAAKIAGQIMSWIIVNARGVADSAHISKRQLLERYKHVREDHLRYMQKWGLIRPVTSRARRIFFSFADVSIVRQADEAVAGGAKFRSVLRNLLASRNGQLTLDFPSRCATRQSPAAEAARAAADGRAHGSRSRPRGIVRRPVFRRRLHSRRRQPGEFDEAATAYRRALEIDPYLVPALINLANIHYSRDEIAEAQALYERAIALEPDVFEAHFNLGNIFHDLGRYREAQGCYRDALKLNPTYADAHFYLA